MGIESVPAEMMADYQRWNGWITKLTVGEDSVVARLNKAANKLKTNRSGQTVGKWGVEEGPQAFQARYSTYLDQEITALTQMANNVTKFVAELRDAVDRLEKGDTSSASNLKEKGSSVSAIYSSERMQQIWDQDTTGIPNIPSDLDY